MGVLPIEKALALAEEEGLDLVEVAPEGNPPVCKIVDYSKILYDQKRKAREARKKQKTVEMKEIKLRPVIDEHDLQVKTRHIEKFIKGGHKVKITLVFRGREITHQDLGKNLAYSQKNHLIVKNDFLIVIQNSLNFIN